MTSTLSRTSSAASTGRRSYWPSANRNSIAMFLPSTYPRSRNPARNASTRVVHAVGVDTPRNPIRGMFAAGCWARPWSGFHKSAATAINSCLRRACLKDPPRPSLQNSVCVGAILGGFFAAPVTWSDQALRSVGAWDALSVGRADARQVEAACRPVRLSAGLGTAAPLLMMPVACCATRCGTAYTIRVRTLLSARRPGPCEATDRQACARPDSFRLTWPKSGRALPRPPDR